MTKTWWLIRRKIGGLYVNLHIRTTRGFHVGVRVHPHRYKHILADLTIYGLDVEVFLGLVGLGLNLNVGKEAEKR